MISIDTCAYRSNNNDTKQYVSLIDFEEEVCKLFAAQENPFFRRLQQCSKLQSEHRTLQALSRLGRRVYVEIY